MICHYAECPYAQDCNVLLMFMLNVTMLNVIILSASILSVVMLSVVMLSDVAPFSHRVQGNLKFILISENSKS